jgi:hypothetical protein
MRRGAARIMALPIAVCVALLVGHTRVAGDMSGDRIMDVVFTGGGWAWACRGTDQGSFTDCTQIEGSQETISVALADVDGTGTLDAVLTGPSSQGATTFCRGDGQGGFTTPPGIPSSMGCMNIAFATSGHDVALADLNEDGSPDAVFARGTLTNRVCLYRPSTEPYVGGFSCADVGEEKYGVGVALGDVNKDGHVDVVFAMPFGYYNRLCEGDGRGAFPSSRCRNVDSVSNILGTTEVALGDVNGDSWLDVVFANSTTQQFASTGAPSRVCWGAETNAFATCQNVSDDPRRGFGVALGDVDGDGDLDAVFANQEIELPSNTASQVCRWNSQAQNFSCADLTSVGLFSNGADVALGDVNDDGFLDAVFARFIPSRNQICHGDGSGAFTCSEFGPAGIDNSSIALSPVRYRFVVMADSRYPNGNQGHNSSVLTHLLARPANVGLSEADLLTDVESLNPDFILFGGDFVYGQLSETEVEGQLSAWKTDVDNKLGAGYSTSRLYPAFGGHERNSGTSSVWKAYEDSFEPKGNGVHRDAGQPTAAFDYFAPPSGVSGCTGAAYGETVYYFDYKNARFLVLNNDSAWTTVFEDPSIRMIEPCLKAWVESKLTTDRKPLNFIVHHETLFPVTPSKQFTSSAQETARNNWVTTLGTNNVTMVFTGHEHQYTRRLISKALVPGATFPGKFFEVKTGLSGPNFDNGQVAAGALTGLESKVREKDHFAVVDVEGSSVSVVVIGISRAADGFGTSTEKRCVDHFSLSGRYPGWIDRNGNGVPDLCEQLGTFAGDDLDIDGTPDTADVDTAIVPAAVDGESIGIDMPEGVVLKNVQAVLDTGSSVTQAAKPAQQFPFGVVAFDVEELNPVAEVMARLTFAAPVPENATYYVADPRRGWYPIPIYRNDGAGQIDVLLRDGGDGDLDGVANHAIVHVGAVGIPGPVVLNSPQVRFAPVGSGVFRSENTGCLIDEERSNPFVGTYWLTAQLTNDSGQTIHGAHVVVRELQHYNRLRNADLVPAGVGAVLTIPGGPIPPNGTVNVPLVVCLRERIPFRFFVEVKGFLQ